MGRTEDSCRTSRNGSGIRSQHFCCIVLMPQTLEIHLLLIREEQDLPVVDHWLTSCKWILLRTELPGSLIQIKLHSLRLGHEWWPRFPAPLARNSRFCGRFITPYARTHSRNNRQTFTFGSIPLYYTRPSWNLYCRILACRLIS